MGPQQITMIDRDTIGLFRHAHEGQGIYCAVTPAGQGAMDIQLSPGIDSIHLGLNGS